MGRYYGVKVRVTWLRLLFPHIYYPSCIVKLGVLVIRQQPATIMNDVITCYLIVALLLITIAGTTSTSLLTQRYYYYPLSFSYQSLSLPISNNSQEQQAKTTCEERGAGIKGIKERIICNTTCMIMTLINHGLE